MSDLSKVLQGAATPDQMAELLAAIAVQCRVETPFKPDYWRSFAIRIEGVIEKNAEKAAALDALQKAQIQMMRC